jgi:CBS domain-containing protein
VKIRDVMTPDVQCVRPEENLVEAAALMRQLDVGSLPVCDKDNVVGMLTDRDIVTRCVAGGRDPRECTVLEAMSPGVVCVLEDDDVAQAIRVMEEHQIRRALVMNPEKQLVGIVSLGDIAVDGDASLSGAALKDISQPAEPVR